MPSYQARWNLRVVPHAFLGGGEVLFMGLAWIGLSRVYGLVTFMVNIFYIGLRHGKLDAQNTAIVCCFRPRHSASTLCTWVAPLWNLDPRSYCRVNHRIHWALFHGIVELKFRRGLAFSSTGVLLPRHKPVLCQTLQAWMPNYAQL